MDQLFITVLDMSLKASWVILAILLIRLFLKKAPRKYAYVLWSVVGFRLLCPVSFQAVFSLFHIFSRETPAIPQEIGFMAHPAVQTGIPVVSQAVNASLPAAAPTASVNPIQISLFLFQILWIAGMVIIAGFSLISLWRLQKRLCTAVLLTDNIYQSEEVCSPFILGLIRPKIYIPYHLDSDTQQYVLTHERFHLNHLDHWVKPFAFFLLTVHWFNPLVWLAFHLMSRDMELRCDEAVLLGEDNIRKAYSTSLLSFAVNRRFPAPGPLAFSESSVKIRIKHALIWKKPRFWVTVIAALLCILVIAACAADPKELPAEETSIDETVIHTETIQTASASPTCQIFAGSMHTPMAYFADGDCDSDEFIDVTPEISDPYTLFFLPSWECSTLTVEEHYYTRSSANNTAIQKNLFELPRNEDGTFSFTVTPGNPDYKEKAIYYIADNNGGKFAARVHFPALDPWGLYLSISEQTTTSMTLHFTQHGGNASGILQTGERFWIERQENGQWFPVNAAADEATYWHELAYNTNNFSLQINWDYLYGALPPGTYRIGKEVHDYRKPGDFDVREYYAVFLIAADTPAYIDPLDAAISQAILEHGRSAHTGENFACESHIILSHMIACGRAADEDDPKAWVGSDTVYLMALYQEYSLTENGLKEESGSHMPIVLSFDSYADGTRTLTEYWTPEDGEAYTDSIRKKFPEHNWADALDTQKFIEAQIQSCYAQAVAYYQLDPTPILDALFAEIAASPLAASAPEAYMQEKPLAVRELVYYGDHTLLYIFRHFLNGNGEGLKGELMRLVMEQLIAEEAIALPAETAQAYFDAWKQHILMLSVSNSPAWMQEHAPKGWLLLQVMEEA